MLLTRCCKVILLEKFAFASEVWRERAASVRREKSTGRREDPLGEEADLASIFTPVSVRQASPLLITKCQTLMSEHQQTSSPYYE